jgi:hypothetical protein
VSPGGRTALTAPQMEQRNESCAPIHPAGRTPLGSALHQVLVILGWPLRAIKAQKNFAQADNVGDAEARKTCQFPMAFLAGGPMTRASMSCCVEGRRRMRTSGPTRARRLRLNGYRSSEHPTAVAKPPFDLIGVPRVAPTYPIAKPAFLAGPADDVGAGASDQVTVVPWPCWGSSAQCPIGVAAPHSCRPESRTSSRSGCLGNVAACSPNCRATPPTCRPLILVIGCTGASPSRTCASSPTAA